MRGVVGTRRTPVNMPVGMQVNAAAAAGVEADDDPNERQDHDAEEDPGSPATAMTMTRLLPVRDTVVRADYPFRRDSLTGCPGLAWFVLAEKDAQPGGARGH